jgi:hypothetical protein
LSVKVDTGTGLDSADTATGRSDPDRRSDLDGRRRDIGCCRLVAGGHGDTISLPARIVRG